MILLIARLRISSEKIELFHQALSPLLAASRAENGCLRYTVSEDTEQHHYFIFTEIWQDEASLHQHESSAHLAQFKQEIGRWIVEREKTQVYHVSAAQDL
jgi:quinol monooxygenase YgiN